MTLLGTGLSLLALIYVALSELRLRHDRTMHGRMVSARVSTAEMRLKLARRDDALQSHLTPEDVIFLTREGWTPPASLTRASAPPAKRSAPVSGDVMPRYGYVSKTNVRVYYNTH